MDPRICRSCDKALSPESFRNASARTCAECLLRRSAIRKTRRKVLSEQGPILVDGTDHSYCSTCNKHVATVHFDQDAPKTCGTCRIKSREQSKRRRQAHHLNNIIPTNTTAPALPHSPPAGATAPESELVVQNAAPFPVNPGTTANLTPVPSLDDQWIGVSNDLSEGNDLDPSEEDDPGSFLAALFNDEDLWHSELATVCVETPTGEGDALEGDDSVDAEAAADALSRLHVSSKLNKGAYAGVPVTSTPSPPEASATAEQFKQEGNTRLRAGEFQRALECYTQAHKIAPTDPKILTNRAMAYMKLADTKKVATRCSLLKKAIKDCDAAVEMDSSWVRAYERKAESLLSLGKAEESISTAEQGLRVSGDECDSCRKLIAKAKCCIQAVLESAVSTLLEEVETCTNVGELDPLLYRLYCAAKREGCVKELIRLHWDDVLVKIFLRGMTLGSYNFGLADALFSRRAPVILWLLSSMTIASQIRPSTLPAGVFSKLWLVAWSAISEDSAIMMFGVGCPLLMNIPCASCGYKSQIYNISMDLLDDGLAKCGKIELETVSGKFRQLLERRWEKAIRFDLDELRYDLESQLKFCRSSAIVTVELLARELQAELKAMEWSDRQLQTDLLVQKHLDLADKVIASLSRVEMLLGVGCIGLAAESDNNEGVVQLLACVRHILQKKGNDNVKDLRLPAERLHALAQTLRAQWQICPTRSNGSKEERGGKESGEERTDVDFSDFEWDEVMNATDTADSARLSRVLEHQLDELSLFLPDGSLSALNYDELGDLHKRVAQYLKNSGFQDDQGDWYEDPGSRFPEPRDWQRVEKLIVSISARIVELSEPNCKPSECSREAKGLREILRGLSQTIGTEVPMLLDDMPLNDSYSVSYS